MKRAYERFVKFLAAAILAFATACSAPADGASSDRVPEAEPSITANELASNGLTRKQASTVLKLVDDICGDTWCEGDHNFQFDQIQCRRPCGPTPGNCRLAFRIFPYDSDLSSGPTYTRSCSVQGFSNFASLVETAANGYQSLNWDFYDALSACISKLESELPPI